LINYQNIYLGTEAKKRLSSLDWTALKRSLDDQNIDVDNKNPIFETKITNLHTTNTNLDTNITTNCTKNQEFILSKNKNACKNNVIYGSIDTDIPSKVELNNNNNSSKKINKGKKDSTPIIPPSMFRGGRVPIASRQSKKTPPLTVRPTKASESLVGGGVVPSTVKGMYIQQLHVCMYG
jgi:hypothetical protein